MKGDDDSRNSTTSARIVFAGGGTGGHLFPAIALAEEFRERSTATEILFIGSGRPLELRILPELGFAYDAVRIQGIKGMGRWHQFKSALRIPGAIRRSMGILKKFKPDIVIGMGGYSAGPVVFAAWLMRIRTALHEQNALPGITNRILSRYVKRAFLSFEDSQGFFDAGKRRIFGNPVRKDFLKEMAPLPDEPPGSKPFTVFIAGGSQGAHRINRTMIEAVDRLKRKTDLFVIHQTGDADEAMVTAAYGKAGIEHRVKAFFSDMVDQYRQADLIICRAGATTVAEVAAMGKPAVFIPFPHAADNHQVLNAASLVSAGGAELIEEAGLSGALLAEKLSDYAEDRTKLRVMAEKVRKMGRQDAAKRIVDDVLWLIGKPAPAMQKTG
ncbi:MAG: undecaprenyldiphospho-muramoylpentapeptide beta-N-acetylglucosaminyltransferase [Desulfobacteraceae bacterium]|nr:undecaprenyldiphospho-muramoylpentapeptide beta-N-acetylglucosaminyltransferase [Desulfobacteraceae bacterium]